MLSDAQLAPVRAAASGCVVVQQALASDPWQVVPAVAAKLRESRVEPALRDELRCAAAVALGRLGLRTAALEAIAACGFVGAPVLREVVQSIPDDVVPGEELGTALDANLAAVDSRDIGVLRTALPAWREWMRSVRAFRTTSGVVVLQDQHGGWPLFLDGAGVARLIERGSPRDGPFYLDGFHAPQAVEALFHATARNACEVQARLVLMAGDAHEALTSLSLRAIPTLLASGRVEVWCGAQCPERLRAEAESRLACTLGWVVAIPGAPCLGRRWVRGEPGRVLATAGEEQKTAMACARQRVDAWEASVDPQERARRFEHWTGSRPRVFILTTRFSTYVQHAAGDIGKVLERMGCDAVVLKEPDEHSILSSYGVLEAVERQRPDFILLINTVRSQLSASLPRDVPVVTWVQDAMPHLFDERTAREFTEHDFLVGHLHPEMFTRFGFPRRRTLYTPVLASDIKFHDAPVDARARSRFECEVAYISHQSETAEEFQERIVAESRADSFAPRLLPHLFPLVVRAASDADIFGERLHDTLESATKTAFTGAFSSDPPPRVFSLALYTITRPLAERVLRQQMMHWAADLCDRRGWRLHIYGKGWERRARFARYARGVLAHGEDLRAAYQCATVQLHAGLGGVHHQRVMECALSGGCTLVRIKAEDIRLLEWWAQNDVASEVDQSLLLRAFANRDDYFLSPIANHWQAMLVQSLHDRLGVPPQHDRAGMLAMHIDQLRAPWSQRGGTALGFEGAWLAGDPAEAGFWDRESFERVVTRTVESGVRRDSLVRWQRGAVRKHFSLSSTLEGIFGMLADPSSRPLVTPATHKSVG